MYRREPAGLRRTGAWCTSFELLTEQCMSAKKAIVRAIAGSLVVAGAMGMSAPVFALDYWVNVPGTLNSPPDVVIAGLTNASYNGLSVPCTASFTVRDTAGSGSVIAASFSGSSACTAIVACNLPWAIGKPLAASGVANNTQITGVCVKIPAPINQTCTGSNALASGIVKGTLTNQSPNPPATPIVTPTAFTFTGSLAASPSNGVCTVNSRANLTTTPASGPTLGIQ